MRNIFSYVIAFGLALIVLAASAKDEPKVALGIPGYTVGQSDINLSPATAPSIPPEKFKSMIRTDKSAILTCIAWQAAKTGVLRIGGKGAMDGNHQFAAKHIENLDVEFTDIDGKRWKAQWVEVKPVK